MMAAGAIAQTNVERSVDREDTFMNSSNGGESEADRGEADR